MPLATPVVLIVFNRPHLTEAVFAAIAAARPRTLFVIADGPRFPEEAGKCQAARSVIDRVDWECEVLTSFAAQNLGCRKRIVSGLNWVFSQVEEAIILEDDCVPHESFFRYCETLLDYYRHDERVMEIGGCNFQFGQTRTEYSYYFSRYSHSPGWATWKRAWHHYDEELTMWPRLKGAETWTRMWDDAREMEYWESIFDRVSEGTDTIWDYQWQFAIWYRNGLSAVPNVNLISNIGFGSDATHTRRKRHPLARLPIHSLDDIRHPPAVTRNCEADQFYFEKVLWGGQMKRFLKKIQLALQRMSG
jgi:hypothetical protein